MRWESAKETAEEDAAFALVGRQAVGLALRVVEFLLPRLYVHVGIGELAKIDFRALYNDVLHGALNRHITQNQGRQSFRREDRKSTRLNSSHRCISYAVFC